MKNSGLNAIAFLEALKGMCALLVALGAYLYVGQDLYDQAVHLAIHLHLDPSSYYLKILLNNLKDIQPNSFVLVSLIALVYAFVRFVEAYGLWRRLRWVEWFTFISSAIYIPFELYEIVKQANILTVGILIINLCVVAYMYYVLKQNNNVRKLAEC